MSSAVGVIFHDPGMYRRVAGMTLLERAVMAMRRGGIEYVAVVVDPEDLDPLRGRISESRISQEPPELLVAEAGRSPEAAREAADGWRRGAPALVMIAPAAIDAGLVSSALEQLAREDLGGPLGVGPALGLWPAGVPLGLGPETIYEPGVLAGTAVAVPDGSHRSRRQATRALLSQSIKPLEIDGVVCYLLVRRISVRISALLLPLPVTPNQVTGFSILLGLAAAMSVAMGTWTGAAVGGVLLMLSLLFDNTDGEIARVKLQGSRFGAWLDIYGDFVVNAAFMAGMAIYGYRRFDAPIYLWAGAATVLAFSFHTGVVLRTIHRIGIPDEFLFKWWFEHSPAGGEADGGQGGGAGQERSAPESLGPRPGLVGRALGLLRFCGRRDFFIFAYMVTALAGVLHWAFWATVAGTAVNFAMTIYQVFLWRDNSGEARP